MSEPRAEGFWWVRWHSVHDFREVNVREWSMVRVLPGGTEGRFDRGGEYPITMTKEQPDDDGDWLEWGPFVGTEPPDIAQALRDLERLHAGAMTEAEVRKALALDDPADVAYRRVARWYEAECPMPAEHAREGGRAAVAEHLREGLPGWEG